MAAAETHAPPDEGSAAAKAAAYERVLVDGLAKLLIAEHRRRTQQPAERSRQASDRLPAREDA